MKLVGAERICYPPGAACGKVRVAFFFLPVPSEDVPMQQVPCPWSPSSSPVSFTSSPAPLLPAGTCFLGSRLTSVCQLLPGGSSRAGRKVMAGAWGSWRGGEVGIRVSGRREQVGTRCLSELIHVGEPSLLPGTFLSLFPPTPLPGITQSPGCLCCFGVWDFKLVVPICSG